MFAVLCLLSGCGSTKSLLHRGTELRERVLEAEGCSFTMTVHADFGDNTYSFSMACNADSQGNVTFSVTEPESISGISGVIDTAGGRLTFDDTALAFSLLADGELSPVSAPWLFLKTLRSGYLKTVSMEDELLRLTIDDSYESDAMQLDIWLDSADYPIHAETIWQGRRILSMEIEDFTIL